jgi:hypothetical protein
MSVAKNITVILVINDIVSGANKDEKAGCLFTFSIVVPPLPLNILDL